MKRPIPLERMEDTMLRHFLCNAELCKRASKGTDEDEDDFKEKGLSYMGLWSMVSLYTDLPNWKTCRGPKFIQRRTEINCHGRDSPMTIRRKCITAAAVLAAVPVIFSLHGQNKNFTEPKGLVVTSTVLDPATRELTVGLQNTSNKTIAAYTLHYLQLDASGQTVSEYGEGQDLLDLNGSSRCIQPGQPISIRAARQADNRSVVSVLVEVIAVIYLDRTYEGIGGVIFDHRMNKAADIRKSIAGQSHTPAQKTKLENEAAFWENAALPQEVK